MGKRMPASVISLKQVNKIYPGVHALKDVDFHLLPGEIHCLVGGNGSGKSTMIKIISGVEKPEEGSRISIGGEVLRHHNSHHALEAGIQVIYQDMALFPNLTVRENIAFRNHIVQKNPFVSWKKIDQTAREAMDTIGLQIDLDQKVSSLSIAQQQLVEIIRSLTGNLSLLILDEPTASLTRKEVNALFLVINNLKEKGITILFVSHKLNEIFEIAENVTILRDGEIIGTYKPKELDHDKLVYLMSGQRESYERPKAFKVEDVPVLKVSQLCKKNNYHDISFSLNRGEILGITGLLGSGRTELAMSLFGMTKPDAGEILVAGKPLSGNSNIDAMRQGIGYVPENRREEGLVYDQSIEANITLTTLLQHLTPYRLLNGNSLKKASRKWAKELSIKIGHFDSPVQSLSGGNQQRVVLAKWLALHPDVLILDEPTVGIDVIAKNSIHSLMKKLAADGMGILMISDEVQEILHNCHRALVMNAGRIIHEFFPEEANEEELLRMFNLG